MPQESEVSPLLLQLVVAYSWKEMYVIVTQ